MKKKEKLTPVHFPHKRYTRTKKYDQTMFAEEGVANIEYILITPEGDVGGYIFKLPNGSPYILMSSDDEVLDSDYEHFEWAYCETEPASKRSITHFDKIMTKEFEDREKQSK